MSQRLTILTFHGIGAPPSSLDPFEQEFWVERESFHFVIEEALKRDDIQITFDDGNVSDYEIAFPALSEKKIPGEFLRVRGSRRETGIFRGFPSSRDDLGWDEDRFARVRSPTLAKSQ